MEKTRICQSCGMPMKKDPNGGGTNADGTVNYKYCSYCFKDGEFTFNGNVKEMEDFCRNMLKQGNVGNFMSWLLTRNIKNLERWKDRN